MTATVEQFRGHYAFLSNFYPGEVDYDGDTYRYRENAYQAAKFPKHERIYFFTCTPAEAKRRGRERAKLAPDWHKNKRALMKEIVDNCFRRNPALRDQLLNTGDAIIQEGNWHYDMFWGVCLRTGRGSNHLGKIHMELRYFYRNEAFLRTLFGASSSQPPDPGASD